jgi:hypothetical protein
MRRIAVALIIALVLAALAPVAVAEEPMTPPVDEVHGVIAYLAPVNEAPEDAGGGLIMVYLPRAEVVVVFAGVGGLEAETGYDIVVALREEGEDTLVADIGQITTNDEGVGGLAAVKDDVAFFNVVEVLGDGATLLTSWEGEGGWLKRFECDELFD